MGSDFTGLSRRKWQVMAAGRSLLLVLPAVVVVASDEPLGFRLLQLLAVLGVRRVFGLYEGVRRGSPVFTVALLVVMAAVFEVLAGVGSGRGRRGGRRRTAGAPGAVGRAGDRRRQPGRVTAA